MPKEKLIVATEEEHKFAQEALHGGRTDVRVLYRDWTESCKSSSSWFYAAWRNQISVAVPSIQPWLQLKISMLFIERFNYVFLKNLNASNKFASNAKTLSHWPKVMTSDKLVIVLNLFLPFNIKHFIYRHTKIKDIRIDLESTFRNPT